MSSYPEPGAGVYDRAPTEALTGPIPERFEISFYAAPALTTTTPTPASLTWDELVEIGSRHERRLTKNGRGFSGAKLKPGTTRKNENVEAVSIFLGDVDGITTDRYAELRERLMDAGLAFFVYSTFKSDEVELRLRFGIPLAEPLTEVGWPDAWASINAHLFGEQLDQNAKDISRMSYMPAAKPDAVTLAEHHDGLALDWRKLPPAPARPAKPANGEGKRGEDLGIGRGTLEFIALGAPKGEQRTRALAATRSLLAAGKSIEETAEKVWQGLQASECGDAGDPWTYEHALAFAKDLAKRKPTKLKEGPTLILDDEGGTGYFSPAERTNGHANGNVNGHAPSAPATNGIAHKEAEPPAEERREPQLKMTEMGIAELLVHLHGQDLRYCFPQACWRTWDGRRFLHDLTGEAPRRAKATVRRVYAIAAEIEDDKKRRALLAWAKGLEKSATVTSMLKLAQSEPGIPILPEDMDADPFLFNVLNGTLDLRAGRLRPHDRADTLTKLAPVTYDQDAACPTFTAFLVRVVPDEHVRRFLQRAVGYCLTSDTSEQCLFFLHGGGANGKSTFLDVVLALLGEYGKQAAPDLLTHKSGDRHPTELADLFGARLVTSVEVDEGKRLAETLVKQMTGGDRMKARYMRGDFFEWAPTHKLFLAANHRPIIRGTDYAIWRRIHLIPFTVTIPESERDGHLPEKLRAELPGILNWAIEGCLEWQRDGLGVPQAVKDATAEYRAEQDTLGDFLVEKCIRDGQAQETAEKLWGAWKTWCEEGGEKEGTQKGFGLRLAERGFTRGRTKAGRFWQGLRLRGLSEDVQGDAFEPGDAWCRDFPYSSSDSPREADMPKNGSPRVTVGNASPGDDPTVCDDCGINEVDMPGLVCDDCMAVAR